MTNSSNKPLSNEEIQGFLVPVLQSAQTWAESELSGDRERATKYYRSKPFGDEEPGRAQYVSAEVRSAVKGMLPSILRVLTQQDGAVEFVATDPARAAEAEQRTDYVRHVFFNQNPGFVILHSVMKDALVRRLGIAKVWTEPYSVEETTSQLVTPDQLQILLADPELAVVPVGDPITVGEPILIPIEVTRVVEKTKIKAGAVPPDEFIINGDAASLEDAVVVAHQRSNLRVGDLVAMGYDIDDILPHAGSGKSSWGSAGERAARKDDRIDPSPEESETDPSTRPVVYTEAWARLDVNQDDIPELRKFCLVGDTFELLHHEPASHIPFALFCPDPEPHEIVGMCPADDTMDLQYVKSHIVRGGLDSLNLTLHPRTAIVEGQVNISDAMNTEIGALIRQKQPGMVQPITHDFVGRDLFPFLGYFDDERASRTGRMKGATGIDADVLQSSTKQAVTATLQHSQEQLEMIVRIFAETGMKQLFSSLAKTIQEVGSPEEIIRVRGKYVPVDPRIWEGECGIEVRTGFGISGNAEKLMHLVGVMEKQEQALQLLGPMNNPLVSLGQYRNALAKATELAGLNADEFWKPVDDQALEAQAAQQPPKPSPEEMVAQAEVAKAQAEVQKKQSETMLKEREFQLKEQELQLKAQELRIKEQELILEDARERHRIEMELMMKQKELEGKFSLQLTEAEIQAAVDREKNAMAAKPPTRKRQIKFERGADGRVAGASMVEEPISEVEE